MIHTINSQQLSVKDLKKLCHAQIRLFDMVGFDGAKKYWEQLLSRVNKRIRKKRMEFTGIIPKHLRTGIYLVLLLAFTSCQRAVVVGTNVVMDKKGINHYQELDSCSYMYQKVRLIKTDLPNPRLNSVANYVNKHDTDI